MSSIDDSFKSVSDNGDDTDSDAASSPKSSPEKRNRDRSLVKNPTPEELTYRQNYFPLDDYSIVSKQGVLCTACGNKVPLKSGQDVHSHVFLQVAVCGECLKFYGKGDFPLDEDGTDQFCRWCGNGGDLFCCSSCTCVFCKQCVKRNLGRDAVRLIDNANSWDCYICDVKPLWSLRARCWGAQQYITKINREKKQKVKATLNDLKEKKSKRVVRRELIRKKSDSTTDSEDEVLRSNSDKENSSSDRSVKGQKNSNRSIRRLFTQPDTTEIDIAPQLSDRKSRKKERMLKASKTRTHSASMVISESDSESEDIKANGAHKGSSRRAGKGERVTDAGIGRKDKDKSDKILRAGHKSKEKNITKRKEKKYRSSSDESDSDNLITSKSGSRPASAVSSTMSRTKGSNNNAVDKKANVPTMSTDTDSSDDSIVNKLQAEKIRKRSTKNQAKENNTGKKKTKKKDTSRVNKEEEVNGVGSGHNSESEVLSSTRHSSDDDKSKRQSSEKKTRRKKSKRQEKAAASSSGEESMEVSRVSAVISSESDNISIASCATEIRLTPTKRQAISNGGVEVDETDSKPVEHFKSSSRSLRRSSCVVSDSPTKKTVAKRSSSADDVRGVDEGLIESPKKTANDSDSSEPSDSGDEMPTKVDKLASDNIMGYMQQQCYVSHALGKSLCKVARIIESKMKSPIDFEETRNIDKVFNRMIRMTKSVRQNARKLQIAFSGKYKAWKRDAVSGNRNSEASAATMDRSLKRVQTEIATWEEEYRLWQAEDGEAVVSTISKPRDGSPETNVSKKREKRKSSTNLKRSKHDEGESPSLLTAAPREAEVDEALSISSEVTQLYDHEKSPGNPTDVNVSTQDEIADISADLFEESNAGEDETPNNLPKKTSTKIVISQSSDELIDETNQAGSNKDKSSGSDDFPVVNETMSLVNSACPEADSPSKKSDSDHETPKKRKSGKKGETERSPACPKSKRKLKISDVSRGSDADSTREEDAEDAVELSPAREPQGSGERTKAVPSSPEELTPERAKALLLATSSDEELSPERAKELLLATSSDGEPLGKLVEKSSRGRKSSRRKKEDNRKSDSKKNGFSSDSDFDDVLREEGKSKKRPTPHSRPKKKISKSQARLYRQLCRSFNDEKLEQTAIVNVHRLTEEELLKHGVEEVPKSQKKSKQNDSDDESSAIARLINLKNVGKRNRTKHGSDSSSSSGDGTKSAKKKKAVAKDSKKAKKSESNDLALGSDSGKDDASNALVDNVELEENELREMNNRLLKEKLLATSSDEDADEPQQTEESTKKTPKKDAKEKAKDDENPSGKKKPKKDDDSDEKKGSGSDDSDVEIKKKKTRRGKLLRMNLSMSDSSEEEAKFKAKEERLKAEKKNSSDSPVDSDSDEDAQRKSKRMSPKKRRNKIKSDSDDSVHLIESASSNSDDDFIIPSKKKKRGKSSDSDSSDQKKKKPKRRRIKTPKSGSDSDVQEVDQSQNSTPGKGRKNIRKVMREESVGEQTKRAAREEAERKKRIEEKQLLYNKIYGTEETPGVKVTTEKLVLDFDPETKEELVKVHDAIVRKLKPHQVRGVEFMWNVCFESVKQLQANKGAGCILAHCMGLGKSFQVVTLVHTLLVNPLTKVHTVLVVCPLSTALNWVNEFRIWLKDMRDDDEVNVFEMSKYKKPIERMHKLEEWHRLGGVMVMNYELYRTLSLSNVKKLKAHIKNSWQKTLVDPGPDLVVCDEGHLLKNEDSAISKAMRKVKTLRRIVLTGTPLQNNLVEYHCMVNFVRPNLLGTRKEFLNRFVNPITNGQYEDSTPHDVKIMKRRAHVLHKMLDGIVQRYDYAELTPFLPEKQEYVVSVRLSEPQAKIYQHFLDNFSGLSLLQNGAKNTRLLPDWHVFQRINTHPKVLLYHDEDAADKELSNSEESEGSLKDFIDDDDDSSESSSGSNSNSKPSKPVPRRRLRGDPEPDEPEVIETPGETANEWWREYCPDDAINCINSSGKLAILFSLLRECEKIGDKVLVFSQSLFSLRLIEEFLERIDQDTRRVEREKNKGLEPVPDPQLCGNSGFWVKGFDYFRLDGSVSAESRNKDCKRFNNKADHRGRLYLISTRAGGLGINLVAANRVVVFDASWNPSHDVQSIFRVFRFGQVKPCYIYRLLAYSTIEERVYERQVTKLSLSCRVVDEHQIDRHYSNKDIMAMYTFDNTPKTDRPTPILPKDRMLAELLKEHGEWIETYHEHDSLLENKADEELNEEERKAAWEEYEDLKKPQVNMEHHMFMIKNNPEALRNLLRSQNPDADEAAIEASMVKVRQLAEVHEQRMAAMQQQRIQQFQLQQQQHQMQRQQYGSMMQNQQFPQGFGLNYQNPAQAAGAYNQSLLHQAMNHRLPNILQTNRNLVKIAPQPLATSTPRISVRNMADMLGPPKPSSSKNPQLINPFSLGMRSVLRPQQPNTAPQPQKLLTPAVSLLPAKPQAPQSSGAPLSPINLD